MSSKKTTSRKPSRPSKGIATQPSITVAHLAAAVAPSVMPLRLISLPANPVSPAASRQPATPAVDPQERRTMIARKAYARALRFGLGKTDPLEDWLLAEQEVDALLARKAG